MLICSFFCSILFLANNLSNPRGLSKARLKSIGLIPFNIELSLQSHFKGILSLVVIFIFFWLYSILNFWSQWGVSLDIILNNVLSYRRVIFVLNLDLMALSSEKTSTFTELSNVLSLSRTSYIPIGISLVTKLEFCFSKIDLISLI